MNDRQVKELAYLIINLDKCDIEKYIKEYKRNYPEEYEQFLKEERKIMKKA